MAQGDTITTRAGTSRMAIDKAAATSGTLIAGVAGKKIHLKRASLTIEAAAELVLLEETTNLELGRYNASLGAGGVADIDPDEQIITTTADKGILYTMSASAGLSGFVEFAQSFAP